MLEMTAAVRIPLPESPLQLSPLVTHESSLSSSPSSSSSSCSAPSVPFAVTGIVTASECRCVSPVLASPMLQQFLRSKSFVVFFAVTAVATFMNTLSLSLRSSIAPLPLSILCVCDMIIMVSFISCLWGFVDTVLFAQLYRTFDFLFMCANILVYTVSGCFEGQWALASDPVYLQVAMSAAQICARVYTSFIVICFDAMPGLPSSIKRFTLLCAFLVYCFIILRGRFLSHVAPETVCLWYCTDTQQLESSATSNMALFTGKYLFKSMQNYRALLMIQQPVYIHYDEHTKTLRTS